MARRRNPMYADTTGDMVDQPHDQYEAPPYQPPAGFAPGEPDPNGGGGQPPAGPGYMPTLEGFDPTKLADPNHAKKSPKYAFGQLANSGQFGYQDGAAMLQRLQDDYDYFDNWAYDNGKFRFTGEGELDSAFEGVDEIDFIRNFTQGEGEFDPSQSAFWWGADSPASRAAEQAGARVGGGAGPSFGSGGGGGGISGLHGGGSGGSGHPGFGGMMAELQKLFPDGLYNKEITTRRSELAREDLERMRKSRMATSRAALADRGMGAEDGAALTSQENIENDTFDAYTNAVSGIYADESENADARMMSALQTAAGLTAEEASYMVNMFRANTDRDLGWGQIGLGHKNADNQFALGQGNLALGNLNAMNNYNLGAGQLGLNQAQFQWDMENDNWGRYMDMIDQWLRGAGISADGYIG